MSLPTRRACSLALLALLVPLAVPTSSYADPAPEPAMFAEQPGTRGFLFEVRRKPKRGDERLFLYGTLHVGSTAQIPFTRAVRAGLQQSGRVALEADVSNLGGAVAQLFALGMYPKGDSLARHVPPALHARLEKALAGGPTPLAQLERMKLFAVPMLLEVLEAKRAGLESEHGADVYLAAYAKQHALPIVEIEGFARQFELLSSLPEPLQLAQLEESLDGLGSGESRTKLKHLVDAWTRGESKQMETMIRALAQSKQPGERAFARRMLDDRNTGMVARAEAMLKETPTTFFAVGAAHLFGEKGIVAELRRRGYEVRELR